ncbi:MAG TPA: hypothetical protein VJH69_04290 [Candidatus Paceibacterota bacterium]
MEPRESRSEEREATKRERSIKQLRDVARLAIREGRDHVAVEAILVIAHLQEKRDEKC